MGGRERPSSFPADLHFVREVHVERLRSTALVGPADAREERLRSIGLIEEVLADNRHYETTSWVDPSLCISQEIPRLDSLRRIAHDIERNLALLAPDRVTSARSWSETLQPYLIEPLRVSCGALGIRFPSATPATIDLVIFVSMKPTPP